MPPWLETVLHWSTRPAVLATLVAFSALSLIAAVVGVPWYLRRLPADYFSPREQDRYGIERPRRSPLRVVSVVFKNTLGAILVLSGLAMLVLPGQGVLTLLVGLLLLDLPGKKKLERRLLALPPLLRAVNAMRQRSGAPPFTVSIAPPSQVSTKQVGPASSNP